MLEEHFNRLYKSFIVCSLQELNKALRIFTCTGCMDSLEEIWSTFELIWDIDHIEHNLEKLFIDKEKVK